jgi:hypothetical protein
LVTKGFTQILGVDYFKTYASVVRYESLCTNIAIVAVKGMEAWKLDFVIACLNLPTQVPIHMEQPESYVIPLSTLSGPKQVALVQKALYITMDGANNLWKMLDEDMQGLRYYCSLADSLVCSQHVDSEVTITSTYTDNITGISSTKEGGQKARDELGHSYKIMDLGDTKYILGICIDHDREASTISLSQHAYFEHILTQYEMSDCKPTPTPLPFGIVLSKSQSPLTLEEHKYMKDKPYCKILGSAMYSQAAVHLDISYSISTLSKFATNPGQAHWLALMHIL